MLRMTVALATLLVFWTQPNHAEESSVGTCTIINTTDHPIVIGLYKPSTKGIAERIVSVPAKTELRDVPV